MKKQIDAMKFIEKYKAMPFSLEEALPDLLDGFEWNPEKARKRAQRDYARRRLSSIKDSRGVRSFVGFNAADSGGDRCMLYQMIETCETPEILKRQKAELSRTIDGTTDTWIKVDVRLDHVEGQIPGHGAAAK